MDLAPGMDLGFMTESVMQWRDDATYDATGIIH